MIVHPALSVILVSRGPRSEVAAWLLLVAVQLTRLQYLEIEFWNFTLGLVCYEREGK